VGEADAVDRSRKGPVTVSSLAAELRRLGLRPGMIVLVHSSLSALGWVCGGAVAVIQALQRVIRPYGTLIMPVHSGELSDPAYWSNPPVPKSWWEKIRKSMPAYDPQRTPSRGMGAIAEAFRGWPEVRRSAHPQVSFAAWGEEALRVVSDHSLEFALGEASPLGRIYELDGWVLLLGVDHAASTSLHLAEYRARYCGKRQTTCGAPILVEGHRRWRRYRDINYRSEDFQRLGHDFSRDCAEAVRNGLVGYGRAQLFPQRLYVDYAVRWLERHRRAQPGQ
jgi:aminoglycoside 3-N-acetyltransferase